ncbi:glycosyltransferase [Candidatus Acetothermia bacterium]|nr:glycosyltransferase [Candidatus Acetothermia bacterium]MBI3643981.1 glycosyltransferase [Candidatus Acetothermia bacterium]
MKKALILTYWYPPKNVIGAVRLTKFAKFLPESGWEPIVVTVNPLTDRYTRSGPLRDDLRIGVVYRVKDRSLNEIFYWLYSKIKLSGRALKKTESKSSKGSARVLEENRLIKFYRQVICFPDESWLWLIFGTREVSRIIEKERPDLIFSSSLPNTAHWMASLMSRKYKIPWVADFRDLWTQNPYLERVQFLKGLEERLERRVMSRASAMTTVSEGLQQELRSRYSQQVFVIPNGFDRDDLQAGGVKNSALRANTENPKFIITLTGTIYSEKSDPSALFEALLLLLRERELSKSEIEVRFYGRKQEFVRSLIDGKFQELKEIVKLFGEVPREQALEAQLQSTILLLLVWTDLRAQGVYTGKVFEYLAAEKPILSIGPPGGVLETLLARTKAGLQATESNKVATILKHWLGEFRTYGKVPFEGDHAEIEKYSRRGQTKMLAEVFEYVLQDTKVK